MKGTVTTLQRMSTHDGPGIRTTVFFKGCNLHCAWCHNPETFKKAPELGWIKSKCINCFECIKQCKSKALYVKNGKFQFNKNACTSCFACVEVCFPSALHIIGKQVSVENIIQDILPDKPFFYSSNGGVTISGGEPMNQPEFLFDFLLALKKQNIHTAIETNLTAPWERYQKILPLVDLVMADLKTLDKQTQKKWIGGNLEQVLSNIDELNRSGKDYILRTPLIPGVNDIEKEEIEKYVGKLSNMKEHEFLQYHKLGNSKYENLGIEPKYARN